MKIAVGPAPSHWGAGKLGRLYHELAECPVDYVYLGETACPRRSCLSLDLLGRICDALTRAGKQVHVSSPTLVRGEKPAHVFGEQARQVGRVEINSPAFLGFARRYPSVIGASLNVYNSAAARIAARHQVERVVLPCELGGQSVRSVATRCPVPTEIIVHGHLPLGISRACQTARAFGRSGNACDAPCRRYPEGMVLEAEGRPLFRIEGRRTVSAATYCLVECLPQLEESGVDTVRVLPGWNHTGRIVRIYRDVLDHRRSARDALEELRTLSPEGLCNGWFLGKAGWHYASPN